MRIYIVGSVASGKTTLAKKLSEAIEIQCYYLDEIVHIKDSSNKEWGNIRRTDEEINRLFNEIIKTPNWIIEDAGRKIFNEGLDRADMIIFLEPNIHVRKIRIITRYTKQRIGIEKCLYRPSLRMLNFMYTSLNNYESGKDDVKAKIAKYFDKVIMLKNKKEIKKFLFDI